MATISVFIPTYNYAKFLSRCLESVLSQTRKADQIFVVDDCSRDDTAEIIKKYHGKVGFVRHKKHTGNGIITFNTGLTHVRGDYTLFVSADDTLHPQIIEKEAAILDRFPQIGLVYSQAYTVENNTKKLIVAAPNGNKPYLGRKNDYTLLLTQGNFIPYMTAMVRTKVYQSLGLFEKKLRYMADWEMWIRIAKDYPLAYLAQPLAHYHLHGKNDHYSLHSKFYEQEYQYILRKYLPDLTKTPSSLKKIAYLNFHIRAASSYASEGNWGKLLSHLKEALKYNKSIFLDYQFWLSLYLYFKSRLGLK